MHVPLLVSGTDLVPRHETTPVGLYRITPTIMKFFGFGGILLQKMTLLADPLGAYEIFSSFTVHERGEQKSVGILDGRHKLI